MHIIIPKNIDGLEGLLQALQSTKLDDISISLRSWYDVTLRLPKFKIESTLSLVEPLGQAVLQSLMNLIE